MTKPEAIAKLQMALDIIFEVEKTMNINTSGVRKYGYRARISVAEFSNLILWNEAEKTEEML